MVEAENIVAWDSEDMSDPQLVEPINHSRADSRYSFHRWVSWFMKWNTSVVSLIGAANHSAGQSSSKQTHAEGLDVRFVPLDK